VLPEGGNISFDVGGNSVETSLKKMERALLLELLISENLLDFEPEKMQ